MVTVREGNERVQARWRVATWQVSEWGSLEEVMLELRKEWKEWALAERMPVVEHGGQGQSGDSVARHCPQAATKPELRCLIDIPSTLDFKM